MKPKNPSLVAALAPFAHRSIIICVSLGAVSTSAFAASQTWDGDTDANWTTAANWVGNGVPGINPTGNNTNTTDVATFDAPINVTTLAGSAANPVIADGTVGNISSNRMIGRIVFDTANAGAYVIGAAGSTTTLQVGNNLVNVDVTAAVVNPQTINAPLALHLPSSTNGFGSIRNNSATGSATLTIAGGILNSPNSTRGSRWTLGGTNTGNNTVSGNITLTNSGGQSSTLTKADAGLWILSGTNNIGGGVIVNDGTLVAQSASAFGTGAVTVNNGVVRIDGGITLGNSNVTLDNSSELRSNGSNTVNRVTAAASAVAPILSTVSSGDVFTIGSAANAVTGGTATSVLRIMGPGTISLPTANNYVGTWSVETGTLNLGTSTALGSLGSLNVAAGAKVQAMGNNFPLTVLTGSGSVSNGLADGFSILTANIAGSNTFAGQLQDGLAGTLGLTKTGAGTLNLSGSSNYTDSTMISTGVLNLTGSLGNTWVSGGSGATLSGNGTIAGAVTVDSGVHVAPGDGGDAAIGTLTVGSLGLNADAQLDFGINNTTSLDRIIVTDNGGLTIDGGQVNINGGLGTFTANGVYPLIGFSGGIGGAGASSLSVNGLNKSVTKTYTFGTSGGFVNLTVANSGVAQTFWNVNTDGNWSLNSNWTPATASNAVGAFAGFGGGGTEITADRTITVKGSFTVGTLAFNGAANGRSYTLEDGGVANITLDNGASGAFVTDTSGNHTINSPLTMTANGANFTVINSANTLTTGGAIGGAGTALVKGGAGTLALSGSNTYFASTIINAGTLEINNGDSMGDPANITTINAGTLRSTADLTSTRFISIGDVASTIAVAPDTTYTIDGVVGDGANVGILNKADSGTLVLTGSNSYTGGTVINGGTLRVNNPNSLGDSGGSVRINSATLQAATTFTGNRNVILGSATSMIEVDPGQTYTVNGVISGSGTLNKTGTGTLTLGSNANTFSGGTVISSGTLAINSGSYLGPGTLVFQGGTLQNNYGNNNTYGFGNPISVPAGQVGTINMGNRMNLINTAAVTGSGTLNINLNTTVTRDDLNNSWFGFTGQVNFAGNGTARMLNNGGTFDVNSFTNSSVDISGNAFLLPVTNSGGNTYTFGALSGSSGTAGIAGASAGTATLSVGGLNTSSTFAGQINGNNALNKVGTGTLTLSGINTYTGNTTINVDSTMVLAASGQLRFVPGANGVSNKITGVGTATLEGALNIGLTAANTTNGNSWLLVEVDTLNESYGTGFTVVGFSNPELDTTWTKEDGGKTWTFDQSTGLLQLESAGYSSWTGDPANGLTAGVNDGEIQDPDEDGISNLMEYVLGGIPAGAGASNTLILPTQTLDAANLTLTFNRSDLSESDTTVKVQWSTDLISWTDFVTVGPIDALPAVDISEDSPTLALDTVVVRIPRAGREVGGVLFARVQAVK